MAEGVSVYLGRSTTQSLPYLLPNEGDLRCCMRVLLFRSCTEKIIGQSRTKMRGISVWTPKQRAKQGSQLVLEGSVDQLQPEVPRVFHYFTNLLSQF